MGLDFFDGTVVNKGAVCSVWRCEEAEREREKLRQRRSWEKQCGVNHRVDVDLRAVSETVTDFELGDTVGETRGEFGVDA